MKFDKREETVIYELSQLYKRYGFEKYKPSCFEEFSLYQENKDFLIGKNVITFSDLGGKLMAMRPDVTLSLVKHNDVAKGDTEKFYYNEKVYRQAAGSNDYKEISQTGVEVVGDIDGLQVAELSILICRTLSTISNNYILDISHMGFTEGLLEEFPDAYGEVEDFLKRKNLHDFLKFAEKSNFSHEATEAFKATVTCGKDPESALTLIEKIALNDKMKSAASELNTLYSTLKRYGFGDKINLNFSATANADYYNGVIFNGYLQGVPHSVLSGGRYDKLLKKLGKTGGAIGFALYLGEIDRFLAKDSGGVDYLVLYDDKTESEALNIEWEKVADGKSVRLAKVVPQNLLYNEIIDLTKGVSE